MVFIVLYAPFEMNLFINTHFDNKMALAEEGVKSRMNWFPVSIIIRYLTLVQEDTSQRYSITSSTLRARFLEKNIAERGLYDHIKNNSNTKEYILVYINDLEILGNVIKDNLFIR